MDPDRSPDPDRLRLTYRDLARRWGIGLDSARHKAKRRGWPVEHGNDGKAWVVVPADQAPPERSADPAGDPSPDRTGAGADPSSDPAPDEPAGDRPSDPVAGLVQSLAAQLAAAERRAGMAEGREALLVGQVAALQAELAAERGRGIWARLVEAWRGRR